MVCPASTARSTGSGSPRDFRCGSRSRIRTSPSASAPPRWRPWWLAQEREPVTAAGFVDFLRRELAPTPGRGSATFRLTLACVIATIPILTHRIPHALVVMIVMYLITQEDTAATLLGSVLGVAGVTLGLGVALLVWIAVIDIAWLRIVWFVAFNFVGLFLKRVLVI